MQDCAAVIELYDHLNLFFWALIFLIGVIVGSSLPFLSDYIRMRFYKGGMLCRQCPWPFVLPRPPKSFLDNK